MSRYLKFAAQVFATALAALVAGLVDDRLDTLEWVNAGIMALGAVAVLGAGELPAGVWRYTKTYCAAASAGLVAWVTFATDGVVTQSEWLQIGLAVLAALGVLVAPGPKLARADVVIDQP